MKNLETIKIFGCAMLASLSISIATGQPSPFSQKYGTEEDYRKLFFLNTQYIQSYVRSDTATHNHLLWADDFVQQSPDGNLIPKKQLSPLFAKPRFNKFEYFYADNVTIQFITNEAALIFAATPLRIKGEPAPSWSQYNDVYIKRDGRWRCVSANISLVKKPGDKTPSFTTVADPPQLISYHPGTEQDKNILTTLNTRHAEAFARSKSNLLEGILADDFMLLQTNGLLYTKNELLEQVKTQAKSNGVANFSIENLMIRFVAPDVAIVHAAIVIKLNDGSVRATQYNDIYVKRENKWVCVSGNNAPIAGA